jgi:hypothetical protein
MVSISIVTRRHQLVERTVIETVRLAEIFRGRHMIAAVVDRSADMSTNSRRRSCHLMFRGALATLLACAARPIPLSP